MAPSTTRCRPVPVPQQQKYNILILPLSLFHVNSDLSNLLLVSELPHQPPPRERTQLPVPRHASNQKRAAVTARKLNHKSSAHNQHLSQLVINHPQKDRQLPRRLKQAKEHIVSSIQNPRSVQQPGRFANKRRDQPRRVEAGSQQSSPPQSQRRPDTHSQETYASVVSDSRQPQCVYPAPFLKKKTDY